MEETLDLIAEEGKDWQQVLSSFYAPFIAQIEAGKKDIKSQKIAIPTGEACPECGADLVQRKGRFGEFIACSAFPKCKYSKNLSNKPKAEPIAIEAPCPECGGALILRSSRRGKFYGCANYPKCTFISTYEPTTKPCPECGYVMAKRTLRGKEIHECIKCKHRIES
jgi:DNA topoisomerase-1